MRNSRLLTVVEGGVQGCLCARGVDAGGVCVCVCVMSRWWCVFGCVCVCPWGGGEHIPQRQTRLNETKGHYFNKINKHVP